MHTNRKYNGGFCAMWVQNGVACGRRNGESMRPAMSLVQQSKKFVIKGEGSYQGSSLGNVPESQDTSLVPSLQLA